jgi:uncharacterized protein (TIGR02996 family)
MNMADAFLQAILAEPADDAPRLIFADWLEEHGDADRAAFIRAQCEAARLGPWERRRRELEWQSQAMLARHGARWRAELPALSGVEWTDFERGFVSAVRVPAAATLYRHADAIAAAAPVYRAEVVKFSQRQAGPPPSIPRWLRALRLDGDWVDYREPPYLSQLPEELEVVRFPHGYNLDWLTTIPLRGAFTRLKVEGDHTVGSMVTRTLARSNLTTGLRRLELGTRWIDYNTGYYQDPTIGPEGARELAESPNLARLEALDLNRQRIGTEGLSHILTSPHLRGLRELEVRSGGINYVSAFEESRGAPLTRLDLSQNPIADRGVRHLANSPRLAQLERLDLDTAEVGPAGLEVLAQAPFWHSLRELDLGHNPLGDAGARTWGLLRDNPPSELHTLRLADCDLDATGGTALAGIPWLVNLLALDLSGNELGVDGLAQLGGLAGGDLRSLSLAATGLEGAAAAHLAPFRLTLVRLDLSRNTLGPFPRERPLTSGLGALLGKGPMPQLLTLLLRRCQLSARALEPLFHGNPCPHLFTLDLADNLLDTEAIQFLLRSPLASQLVDLDLSRNDLRDSAAALLAGSPALARVRRLNLCRNGFTEEGLVALATSRHLAAVTDLLIAGQTRSYGFSQGSQRLLNERFGERWNWQPDEDDPEYTDEE